MESMEADPGRESALRTVREKGDWDEEEGTEQKDVPWRMEPRVVGPSGCEGLLLLVVMAST